MKNIEVVRNITNILDDIAPLKNGGSYESLIDFVDDRPGHDQRYAVDIQKVSGNWVGYQLVSKLGCDKRLIGICIGLQELKVKRI